MSKIKEQEPTRSSFEIKVSQKIDHVKLKPIHQPNQHYGTVANQTTIDGFFKRRDLSTGYSKLGNEHSNT